MILALVFFMTPSANMTPSAKRSYDCDVCGKQYLHKRNLQRHKAKHEDNPRRFECEYPGCGRSFLRPDEARDHKKIHSGVGMHSCEYCGKQFTRASDLRLHIKRHTKTTKYACHICQKAFVRRCDLQQHIKRRHRNEDQKRSILPELPATTPHVLLDTAEANAYTSAGTGSFFELPLSPAQVKSCPQFEFSTPITTEACASESSQTQQTSSATIESLIEASYSWGDRISNLNSQGETGLCLSATAESNIEYQAHSQTEAGL